MPPGDVTVALSCAAEVSIDGPADALPAAFSSSRSRSIAAEPAIVCTARSVATERGRPASTPASTSASTIRKKYAGPDPDTVVGDVSGDDWEAARQDLVGRRAGFADLLAGKGLTLRSDLLLPWSRWITPEFEPRRFDTYFFVALLPEGQRTRDVSGEADHTLWLRPADALARAEAGELTMLPPTMVTLAEVAAAGDLDGVARDAAERDPGTPILPYIEGLDGAEPRFLLR